MTGWNLPPGCTDADIDRAAPGFDEPAFYCIRFERDGYLHCLWDNRQCELCEHDDPLNLMEQTKCKTNKDKTPPTAA